MDSRFRQHESVMVGVTTALLIAAVQYATAKWSAAHPARAQDAG
ncbi:hypothetical protein [Mesorhizobium wenxiniae]|nr:hypothetical protein [Mesorhizobium wenxiniae]